MSEKASGNGAKKRDPRNSQDDLSGPEGKEISLDPESGDLLEPVERWWNEETEEEKEDRRNRKAEPGEKRVPREEPPASIEEPAREETSAVVVPLESIKPLTPITPADEEEDEVDEMEELFGPSKRGKAKRAGKERLKEDKGIDEVEPVKAD
ncbi:MAG: hypothetical protein P1U81_16080, partial [Verrucomicrobiales bacterium]|nr:hypothetical protein [Verrucomicrobiales bacterium]